jgi:hypothetical protein
LPPLTQRLIPRMAMFALKLIVPLLMKLTCENS